MSSPPGAPPLLADVARRLLGRRIGVDPGPGRASDSRGGDAQGAAARLPGGAGGAAAGKPCRPDIETYAVVADQAVLVDLVTVEAGAPVVSVPGWRWCGDEPDAVGELVLRERARLAQVRLIGWWSPLQASAGVTRLRMDVANVSVRDEERVLELDAADGFAELFR